MRFHVDHTVSKPGFSISHSDAIFLVGSCFSENMGKRLTDHKFNALSNPNGILFNPFSVYECLQNVILAAEIDERLLVQRDGLHFSYLHHSSIHARSGSELAQQINAQTKQSHAFLRSADHLIITFGTAFYYHHRELDLPVANCHKQAAQVFEKRLLSVDNIVSNYSLLLQNLKTLNPKLNVILTVSPVKYLKDGLVENNLSKATLTLSVHELIKKHSNCFYFPAYELVNDDLRDHRFYKADLAHPNEQAIDYIWDKFSDCFFTEKTREINKQIEKLNSALLHRQMQGNVSETAKLADFIEKQKLEIRALCPEIKF